MNLVPDDLAQFVQAELRRLAPEVGVLDITPTTSISELGVESVTIIELVASLEDRFDVDLPDEELSEIDSIADLVRIMTRHVDGHV